MAKLSDIAEKAGVNVTTVSRALNGSMEIKEETKEKIISIARELNYFANKSAKMYSNINNCTIGIICPEVISNYYAHMVNTIEEKITDRGYTIFIGLSKFKQEKEVHFLNLYAKKGVRGIIYITTNKKTGANLREFKSKYDIPVIQVAVEDNLDDYDSIVIDDRRGISMAIEHLLELGHTDFCYVGDALSTRLEFFTDTLTEHGIKVDNDYIRVGKDRFEEGGYIRMKEILSLKKLPTAVIASYDNVAIGAMKAIYEHGLRIPEDISVIGVDDINVASYLYKGLTTVSSPVNEMGNIATRILLDKIEDPTNKVIQHIVLNTDLITRETTARTTKKMNLDNQK